MGQLRLKDFIRAIRACKTAADERAVIAKESAAIRTSFKDDTSLEQRNINIQKLLYIHMLGHPAHFGQIECLKLVAGGKYQDKRLGYLGIMLLLDENQEVLTLVTNSLKNDMNSQNMYIVGLALVTMGNIASSEMARDLAPEVDKLMNSSNSYIKKKAILAAVKILRKVPDLLDQFASKAKQLLNEKNHAVLLTGVSLLQQICELVQDKQPFKPLVPHLNRHLKTLISSASPEHEVSGINDPFLQVKILRLLRLLGKGDREASDQMNDVLAQIATNTDGSKNVGNAILYETCLTIMEIEADSGLRVLAVNILGRFLTNTDNNIRYVALNTLTKTIQVDLQAVQRHRQTVLECLHDPDISIKRRALDLSFCLVNETNIRVMVRELLLFLEVADTEFKQTMPTRLCQLADTFAPNKRWHIDTIIRVLKLAGNYVKDDVLGNFIKLVASTPDLHAYAVYKLFYSLKEDLSQEALVLAAVWCLGEYGEILFSKPKQLGASEDPNENVEIREVGEREVMEILQAILEGPFSSTVAIEYVLTTLLKLTTRVSQTRDQIVALIKKYSTNIDLEIQQRSVEYYTLLTDPNLSQIRPKVLEKMPVPQFVAPQPKMALAKADSPVKTQESKGLLDDLLSLDTGSTAAQQIPQAQAKVPGGLDALADVFGSVPASQPTQSSTKNDILSLFNQPGPSGKTTSTSPVLSVNPLASLSPTNQTSPPPQAMSPTGIKESIAYEKNGLQIKMVAQLEQPTDPVARSLQITATFRNSSAVPLSDVSMQVAVPKTLKLQLMPASGTSLAPGATFNQLMKIMNPTAMTAEGKGVGCRLRLKVAYTGAGRVDEVVDFPGFPGFSW